MKANEAISKILSDINGDANPVEEISSGSTYTVNGETITSEINVSSILQGNTIVVNYEESDMDGVMGLPYTNGTRLCKIKDNDSDFYVNAAFAVMNSNSSFQNMSVTSDILPGIQYSSQNVGLSYTSTSSSRVAGTSVAPTGITPGVYSEEKVLNSNLISIPFKVCIDSGLINGYSSGNTRFTGSYSIPDLVSHGYSYTPTSSYQYSVFRMDSTVAWSPSYGVYLYPSTDNNNVLRQYSNNSYFNHGWLIEVPSDRSEFNNYHLKVYQNIIFSNGITTNVIPVLIEDIDLSLIQNTGVVAIRCSKPSGTFGFGPLVAGYTYKAVACGIIFTIEKVV